MDTRIVIVVAAALFSIFVISFLFRFILLYQKKNLAFEAEKKVIETRFQQEMLQAQLEIQEQTLKNISQEIHDNIGQTLSLAKLNLNTIDLVNPLPKVDNSKQLLTKAIADLRALSRTLHTDTILSAGLLKAIEFELQQLERSGAFSTDLEVDGPLRSLNPQHELILFRIVQEALNNIIKHAEANRVAVKAHFTDTDFTLQVQDNGKGFNLPQDASVMDLGIGMKSMNNRVALLQGRFAVKAAAGNGTIIHINIPA